MNSNTQSRTGPWRWYHETLLDCCINLDEVKRTGLSFNQFICLSECHGCLLDLVQRIEDLNVPPIAHPDWENALNRKCCQQSEERAIIVEGCSSNNNVASELPASSGILCYPNQQNQQSEAYIEEYGDRVSVCNNTRISGLLLRSIYEFLFMSDSVLRIIDRVCFVVEKSP